MAIRGLVGAVIVAGLLVWSGAAHAVKPNPQGKQANQFVVLPTGDVLDVRTGLRWQQEAGSANVTGAGASCNGGANCVWQEAVAYCAALGGGSRLAEVKELISLVDYSQFNPALPAGHPFINVRPGSPYWSATTDARDPAALAWVVFFGRGQVFSSFKSLNGSAWCVRGGREARYRFGY